jgi:hypothetical protein
LTDAETAALEINDDNGGDDDDLDDDARRAKEEESAKRLQLHFGGDDDDDDDDGGGDRDGRSSAPIDVSDLAFTLPRDGDDGDLGAHLLDDVGDDDAVAISDAPSTGGGALIKVSGGGSGSGNGSGSGSGSGSGNGSGSGGGGGGGHVGGCDAHGCACGGGGPYTPRASLPPPPPSEASWTDYIDVAHTPDYATLGLGRGVCSASPCHFVLFLFVVLLLRRQRRRGQSSSMWHTHLTLRRLASVVRFVAQRHVTRPFRVLSLLFCCDRVHRRGTHT